MSPSKHLKADLHVHSYHSGYSTSLPMFRSRDSYSDPEAVYRTAKAEGMDLVTITDHDSIDGCLEFLDRNPDASDFIIGEEIECFLPDTGLTIHVGALGLTEALHREIQSLRDNVYDVAGVLRREGLAFSLNHPFLYYRGQVELTRYAELLFHFPALEARNGTMLEAQNRMVERILEEGERRGRCLARFGGSDAHVLRRVGTTYTEVRAGSREEFLEKLKRGESRVGGRDGSTFVLAGEIYGVILSYWGSLLGLGKSDLVGFDRMRDVGISALSLPFQFLPFLIAAGKKSGEARRVELLARRWREFVEGERREPSPVAFDSVASSEP